MPENINFGERHSKRTRNRRNTGTSALSAGSATIRDISHLVLRRNTRLQNREDNTVPVVEVFENQATGEKKEGAKQSIAERLKELVVTNLRAGYEPHKPNRVLVAHGEPIENSHIAQLSRVFTFEDIEADGKNSHRHHLAVFGTVHRPAHSKRIYDPNRIDEWLAEAHLVVMDPHELKEVFATVRFPQAESETMSFTGSSGVPERFDELNITRGLLEQIGETPHYLRPGSQKKPA